MSEKIADELHAFIAAAPHKYPGHLIELFDRAEKALRRCSADSAQPYGWHAAANGLFSVDPRCAEVWRHHMGLDVTPVYTRSTPADSAQPEVWMWRATVGGVWGSWRLLDQPIDEFKKSAWGFNLGNGTAEVRALYARPERTEPQSAGTESHSPAAMEGEKDTIVNLIHEHVGFEALLAIESGVLTGVEDAAEAILAELGRRSQADISPQSVAVPASVDEIERIIRIEFHAMPEAARHAAERVYNFLDARIFIRAKTLARQTTASGLPHCEGQAVECDGGLHSQAEIAK